MPISMNVSLFAPRATSLSPYCLTQSSASGQLRIPRSRGATIRVPKQVDRRDTGWLESSPSESVSVSGRGEFEGTARRRVLEFLSGLYAFSRPHTVAGTVVSICSISLLAMQDIALSLDALKCVATALSASILMNVFIVGLNQIFDLDIDKINKPYLPLPSGRFSMSTAINIVTASLIGSLMIGWWSQSPALLITLVLSMVLGIAYSMDVPFLRWKRNAALAALCILIIRAVAVQFGFYFHVQYSLGRTTMVLSKPVMVAMGLLLYYSIVIALFKDIPDIKGDIEANIRTFTVRLGQKSVFWICIWLLTAMYGSAIVVLLTRVAFPLGNGVSLYLLWREAKRVNLDRKQEITQFYMFVWRLFYLLYFFFPILRFGT